MPVCQAVCMLASLGFGSGSKFRETYCWLGWLSLVGGGPHSLSFSQAGLKLTCLGRAFSRHMTPTLASKTLKRGWILVTGWAFPPCTRSVVTLFSTPGPHTFYPTPCGQILGWGCLPRTTAIPLLGFGQLGVPLPLHPHMHSHAPGD